MPIFIFDKQTRLFSIMILSSVIYPIDDRTLLVKDNFCIEYQLVFDSHEQLQETMIMLYKEKISYVYCDYYLVEQTYDYFDTQEREIDPYIQERGYLS